MIKTLAHVVLWNELPFLQVVSMSESFLEVPLVSRFLSRTLFIHLHIQTTSNVSINRYRKH